MKYKKSIGFAAFFAVAGVMALNSTTLAVGLEGERTGMSDMQKQQVEERKTVMKERLEAKKLEMTEKLSEKRLAACEKRQDRINKVFSKATEQNKKQLAVFQKIEENVKAFYAKKNLSADGYDAAVANADEKEAIAVAAIETSISATFDCASTDPANPGAVIKEAMKVRHESLKNYRTAIKDLILVVKKHNGQQRDSTRIVPETAPNTREEQ